MFMCLRYSTRSPESPSSSGSAAPRFSRSAARRRFARKLHSRVPEFHRLLTVIDALLCDRAAFGQSLREFPRPVIKSPLLQILRENFNIPAVSHYPPEKTEKNFKEPV